MIKKYSDLQTEQTDEFFHQQWEESWNKAQQDLMKEFNRSGTISIEDPESPGNFRFIVSKSPSKPNTIQCTSFIKGKPWGHSEHPMTKKGLLECIDHNGLTHFRVRKDIPDGSGLGAPDQPTKYFYKLRLRDVGPGTVPPGFVETRGNRVVVYDKLLSSNEISKYELEPLGYDDGTIQQI